jgi:sugar phosphate isomerase/epimerase
MFPSLLPELVSLQADLPRAIDLAARHGFARVDTTAEHLAAPDLDPARVLDSFASANVRPGYFSLPPGRVPVPDADWNAALSRLPAVAERAWQLGYTRAALVVLPFHETLGYADAFSQHVRRLNAVTDILDDFGIALALEYVSPPTRRAPYPEANHFVHDLRGMLALCDALRSPRAGLLLDSFHWHGAGETAADIAGLPVERIVVVHINDAPDVPLSDLHILDRALPGATGVIDLAGFVGGLRAAGYDGPVTCEPMGKAIDALGAKDDDTVLAAVAGSMRRALSADFRTIDSGRTTRDPTQPATGLVGGA